MGLSGVFRATASKLIGGLGAQEDIILRTPSTAAYDTSTLTAARTEKDRVISAVRVKDARGEEDSTFRRELTFLIAAQGLAVDVFRAPDQGDRVVVGADLFGDGGWSGGKEYEVVSFDTTAVGGDDVMYEMVVGR